MSERYDETRVTIRQVTVVVKILKARFSNMSAEEAMDMAGDIVMAVENARGRA